MQGSRFVYERFAGYQSRENGEADWTSGPKVAHFERIEWLIIPDAATAAAALQSGEVDWWELPTSDLLSVLRRGTKINVAIIDPTGNCGLLRPNHLHPPFDSPAVRRALLGAIDQTEFMTAVMGEDRSLWKVPCGYFTSLSPAANDSALAMLAVKPNYEKVRRDLLTAGYRGERVVLMAPQDVPNQKAMSEIAADTMRRVGMDVDYQVVDWGTILQRRASKSLRARAAGTHSAHASGVLNSFRRPRTRRSAAMARKPGSVGHRAPRSRHCVSSGSMRPT